MNDNGNTPTDRASDRALDPTQAREPHSEQQPPAEEDRRHPVDPVGKAVSARRGFPSAGDLLALIGIYLVSYMAAMLTAFLAGCAFPSTEGGETIFPAELAWGKTQFIVYILTMTLTVLFTLLYRRARGGRGPLARFSPRGLNPILILWGVVLLVATVVVTEPLVNFFRFLPMPDLTPGGWTVLTAVAAAPLFEEFLCRGVVLESLRSRYGVVAAWLVSSIFFAVIHLHPALVVNAFIIGLILAYIYIRSSSLFPGIILHAFNNALALVLAWTVWPEGPFAGKSVGDLTLREIIGNEGIYALVYIVSLVVFIASAYMVYRTLRRMKADEKKRREA